MDVKEVLLPGVGLRYEFTDQKGDRIGIIARRSGDFDVVVYAREDPDEARPLLHLSDQEAEAVAQILGAPRIAERFTELAREIPGLETGQVHILAGSPFVDHPLGDTRARTRTGASIVAIVRNEEVLASPGPAEMLHAQDVLIVIGTENGIAGVEELSTKAEPVQISGTLLLQLGALLATLAVLGCRRTAIRVVAHTRVPAGGPGPGQRRHPPDGQPAGSSSPPAHPSASCCCCSPWAASSRWPNSPAACATTCRPRASTSCSTPRPARSPAGYWGWTAWPSCAWPASPTSPRRASSRGCCEDLHRLGNRETPAVLSVLVLEDFAMAAYLPLFAVLASGGGWLHAIGGMVVAVGALMAAFAASYRWGHHVDRLVEHPDSEQLMLRVLGITLIVAAMAESLHASAAVGAFLVGLTLTGETAERARQVLGPLRDLFAAIFFLAIGYSVDPHELVPMLPAALILAVVTAATKVATGMFAARHDGVARRGQLRAGAALIARGEFSLIIIGLAGKSLPAVAALATSYVFIMAIVGPILARYTGAPRAPGAAPAN